MQKHLIETLKHIESELTEQYTDRHHCFHTACVATISDSNPEQRTVVIRHVDFKNQIIEFHTDIRSGKCNDIQHSNQVSMLFYDIEEKMQLRFLATATIEHKTPAADKRWHTLSLASKRCYLSQAHPGKIIDRPHSHLPSSLQNRSPSMIDSQAGYENFAIISCHFSKLDCLNLDSQGHKRCFFQWKNFELVNAEWIAP